MEEERDSFYSELNSNQKQWLLCGVPGPPFLLIAWITSFIGSIRADAFAAWGLALCALAAILLPIRSVVSLIEKDDRRVVLLFFGLAVLNGLLLYLVAN